MISVHDLLADSALEIPQDQRPYKWTGKNIVSHTNALTDQENPAR